MSRELIRKRPGMTADAVVAVGERAIVQCQGPVRLNDYNDPQPDFALLAPRADFYKRQRPTPADTHLLIEVSDTTARYDLHTKKRLYARHGVTELWVLNLAGERMHLFRNPSDGDYEVSQELQSPEIMLVSSLPGVEIDLSDVL